MVDLFKLIYRFQSLKAKTGAGKVSSYQLTITFDPDGDNIELQWGCYVIADYPRTYETTTTRDALYDHMQSEIEMMEAAVDGEMARMRVSMPCDDSVCE
jgi:hypothetical protein